MTILVCMLAMQNHIRAWKMEVLMQELPGVQISAQLKPSRVDGSLPTPSQQSWL